MHPWSFMEHHSRWSRKNVRAAGWERILWNIIFQTWHGCYHSHGSLFKTCTRSGQSKLQHGWKSSAQSFSPNWGAIKSDSFCEWVVVFTWGCSHWLPILQWLALHSVWRQHQWTHWGLYKKVEDVTLRENMLRRQESVGGKNGGADMIITLLYTCM